MSKFSLFFKRTKVFVKYRFLTYRFHLLKFLGKFIPYFKPMSYTRDQAKIEIGKRLIKEYNKDFHKPELYKIYGDEGLYTFFDKKTTLHGNRYTISYPFTCVKLNNYANYSILVIYNDQEEEEKEKVKIDFNLIPTNTKIINDILDFLKCIEDINKDEIFEIFKGIEINNSGHMAISKNEK